MRYIERKFICDYKYILPIGDIHIGDAKADLSLLKKNIDWAVENDALIIGVGDWLNVALRNSKSNPFQQNLTLQEQIDLCVKLFYPIRNNIVGVVQGNHEARSEKDGNIDPLSIVCVHLGCEYLKYSGVIGVIVGTKKKSFAYTFYVHHTTGGGQTPGGKINRVDKLRGIVSNCDCYLGGHNHSLGVMPVTTRTVDTIHKYIVDQRQVLIDCGSYVKYDDNYSEQMGLQPVKLGSPRIRLDGKKRDVHVSV
jgi:hypothetical protein